MESPTPNPGQGGRTDRQPGKDDDRDVGSDPRRTREKDDGHDTPRPTREDVRRDDTPKAG